MLLGPTRTMGGGEIVGVKLGLGVRVATGVGDIVGISVGEIIVSCVSDGCSVCVAGIGDSITIEVVVIAAIRA
ncbi:MAG: hypothetical protein IMY76_02495 [Chloroflexi bacterium]|nr:hypothetical protein [Chloroflexota bacterium]